MKIIAGDFSKCAKKLLQYVQKCSLYSVLYTRPQTEYSVHMYVLYTLVPLEQLPVSRNVGRVIK